MRRVALMFFLGTAVFCYVAQPALAIKQFYDVFVEEYVDGHENEEFVKLAGSMRTGCLICHQGKKRTHHNPYGIHLVELLDKKKDKKDKEKILAAIKKVAKLHSDPKDDKSPTYGELIVAGKFPGGTIEELKKEPEKEDE